MGAKKAPSEADVIEVTPEMIEAGAEEIVSAYGGLDLTPNPSVVAASVFRAMTQTGRSKR